MKQLLLKIMMVAGALLMLSACSEDMSLEEPTSELHFKRMGGNCALRFAREPSFNVCINDAQVDQGNSQKVKGYLERALLTWMRAVKQIDQKVVGNINFTCEGKTHLSVRLRPGSGTSFASCGAKAKATIYVGKTYGTTLHELGHAFAGLGDTYSGRSAGNCQPGQPASIMCWGAYGPKNDEKGFSLLWEDDVAGIQSRYREQFTDLVPTSQKLDVLGGIDVNNPWPGKGSSRPEYQDDIFVKLVSIDSFTTEQTVLVSAPASENKLLACEGISDSDCLKNKANIKISTRIGTKNGQIIYQLKDPIDPGLGRGITIFAGLYNNKSFRVRHLKALNFEKSF